jgi:hypothetical protein
MYLMAKAGKLLIWVKNKRHKQNRRGIKNGNYLFKTR